MRKDVRDFLDRVAIEGVAYTVLDYYPVNDLYTLSDEKLSRLAVSARESLLSLNNYLEEL